MDGDTEDAAGRYTLLSVVAGRDRQRRVLLAGTHTTVGELAGLVGAGAGESLRVDGRWHQPDITLPQAGVVTGSVVDAHRAAAVTLPVACAGGRGGGCDEPVVVIRCTAGPAAGVRVPLPAGRHVLGRSPAAAVRIRDPSLELHALLLDVGADGRVVATQLTGAVPVIVDDEIAEGARSFAAGSVMHVGASRIEHELAASGTSDQRHDGGAADARVATAGELGSPGTSHQCGPSPWLRYWWRRGRRPQRWAPPATPCRGSARNGRSSRAHGDSSLARSRRSTGDPASTGVTVNGAAALLVVLATIGAGWALPRSSAMWSVPLITAAIGAALATHGAIRRSRARRHRSRCDDELASRRSVELDRQRRKFLDRHRRSVPAIDVVVETADAHGAALWERRGEHDDAFTVTLGYGPVEWRPVLPAVEPSVSATARATGVPDDIDRRDHPGPLEQHGDRCHRGELGDESEAWYSEHVLDDERVPFTLAAGTSIAIAGHAAAVARSIVVQLAVAAGPADWELLVVTNRRASWDWCRWLPHVRDECVCNVADLAGLVGLPSVLGSGQGHQAAPRQLVVIVDAAGVSDPVLGQLSGILGDERRRALVVLADDDELGAIGCQAQLTVGSRHRGLWTPDAERSPARWPVHAAGVTDDLAWRVALSLACLVDPERPGHNDPFVPPWVTDVPAGEASCSDKPSSSHPFG